MKVQEVILRAMAKKITGWQAAEIIGHQRAKVQRWRRPRQFRFESDQARYRSVVRLRLLLEISPNEVSGLIVIAPHSGCRSSRPDFGFEIFLEVAAGPIGWIVLAQQTAHHQAPFERTDDQRRQL